MPNLLDILNKNLTPQTPQMLKFIFAGEDYACDIEISELEVPEVELSIPMQFIRAYNLITRGKKSNVLPNPEELWHFLGPNLLNRGLVAPNAYGTEESVDNTIRELLEWEKQGKWGAIFQRRHPRKYVILNVKAEYDPY